MDEDVGSAAVPATDESAAERLEASPVVGYRSATMADLDAIHELIGEAARTTTVLPRTRDSISEHLRDFIVAEQAGRLIGCGALGVFTRSLAEVKSLVVAPGARGLGIGGGLVRALIEEARRLGVRRVFALTDNPPFFQRQGFNKVDKLTLPHKVWNECIRCPKFLHCTEEAVDLILTGMNDNNGNA